MLRSKHGVHGPNSRFADAQAPWTRLLSSGATWLKLLGEHTADDARRAVAAGCRVLVRTDATAGGLMPVPEQVRDAITTYAGLAAVIEVGNEPPVTEPGLDRWAHALRMEEIATAYLPAAHAAGMQLCTGGWTANEPPPSGSGPLDQRLRAVYRRFDAIGVHVYDPGDLLSPAPLAHLAAWHACFPDKPIYITEYGLAYLWLLRDAGVPPDPAFQACHDLEKARRYTAFLRYLAGVPWVEAAFVFILGGVSWGDLDDLHQNGYWLDTAAWAAWGAELRAEKG